MKPSEYKKFLEIHSEAARVESKEAAAWGIALEMFGLVEFPTEETKPTTEKKNEKPKPKRSYSYKTKKCERCGNEFTPSYGSQKLRDECKQSQRALAEELAGMESRWPNTAF